MATPLKNAKGLGSAKHGLGHWITQRVTALALLPLTLWFVSTIALMTDSSYESALTIVSNPFNATLLILLIVSIFWHSQLGLQVVIEDYISKILLRKRLIIGINSLSWILTIISIISVLKIVIFN